MKANKLRRLQCLVSSWQSEENFDRSGELHSLTPLLRPGRAARSPGTDLMEQAAGEA